MIPVTVLVSGVGTVSHKIKGKFGVGNPSRFSSEFRPVIVWNMTYKCNLKCAHCYINAGNISTDELTTEEALDLIDQIAEVSSPLLILSGGEPLVRRDFMEIVEYATSKKLKVALSTNGTLITEHVARKLSDLGIVYVGISIDSPDPQWHDMFRGVNGAFQAAIAGLKNAAKAGLSTGLRYTITRYNVGDAPSIIDLTLKLKVPRVTFYHLSAAGRAKSIGKDWYVTPSQYFNFIDYLIQVSKKYVGALEIETTMAPFDGICIADKIAKSSEEFWKCLEVVKAQGGCGRKIISIYPNGNVYPCQFVDFMFVGNVRQQRLKELLDINNPSLRYFIETEKFLKGPKCSTCPFKSICKGGDRIRAYYLNGGLHEDDPQCFLDVRKIYERWSS